jgi:hypothetical protein
MVDLLADWLICYSFAHWVNKMVFYLPSIYYLAYVIIMLTQLRAQKRMVTDNSITIDDEDDWKWGGINIDEGEDEMEVNEMVGNKIAKVSNAVRNTCFCLWFVYSGYVCRYITLQSSTQHATYVQWDLWGFSQNPGQVIKDGLLVRLKLAFLLFCKLNINPSLKHISKCFHHFNNSFSVSWHMSQTTEGRVRDHLYFTPVSSIL